MKRLLSIFTVSATLVSPTFAGDLTSISFKTIDGKETSLADYKGKVVLLVNTASKCGLTRQYKGLEALYQKYKGQGFVILGFPCNDFGNQEPGTLEEIQEFCEVNYGVSFPMMSKIHVKGADQHPLYTALTGEDGAFPGNVKWNFGKFLIGKDGKPIARFEPRQKPDNKELVEAIEEALAK